MRRLAGWVDKILEGPDDESKHARRGLEEVARLAQNAAAANPQDRRRIEIDLVETVLAVNNLERPPIPRRFDAVMLPMFFRQFHRPIGVGSEPAENLAPGLSADLSRRDPLPSSFSVADPSPESKIYTTDLDEQSLPSLANKLCRYREPKETSGMNPGYEVECDNEVVKLKFGGQSAPNRW